MEVLNAQFLSVSAPGYSDVFRNEKYTILAAQVDGVFSGLSLILEGRSDTERGEWESIAALSVSSYSPALEVVTERGIYEYPIEGVRELRFRVLSVSNGRVEVTGVFYDSADGTRAPTTPYGASVQFGNPALFVKGTAETIFFDPQTGNICGYDKTGTESAVQMSANLSEITGGFGNRLVGILPDTVRISGTYTAAAFSLQTRAAIMGGNIAYNAVSKTCEIITAASDVLTIAGTPAPSLAESAADETYWCYVHDRADASAKGTNYGISPVTKRVQGFTATAGHVYEVEYWTHRASSASLMIPTVWNPVMMTVQIRYGVYARQGSDAGRAALAGWIYFICPRCILNADAGIEGSQTSNAPTSGSWLALSTKAENIPGCECDDGRSPTAYYVYVPCENPNDAVEEIVSIGAGLSLRAGQSDQLPVKLLMGDGTLIQPDFMTFDYRSENDGIAVVSNSGEVRGTGAGKTTIWTYCRKSTGEVLQCKTIVSVSGTRAAITANTRNISFT